MEVSREQAIGLFTELGYKVVTKWDNTRLQNRLNKLPTILNGERPANPDLAKLLDTILVKRSLGEVVTIISSKVAKVGESESKKETAHVEPHDKDKEVSSTLSQGVQDMRKSRKGNPNGKGQGSSSSLANRNAFGSRLGSLNAKVDACISKKPKTMTELMQEAKVKATFYNHLTKLVEKKLVKKTDHGYALA